MASSELHKKLVAHIIYPVLMYWTMGEGEFPSTKERLPTARWWAAPSFVAGEENTHTSDAGEALQDESTRRPTSDQGDEEDAEALTRHDTAINASSDQKSPAASCRSTTLDTPQATELPNNSVTTVTTSCCYLLMSALSRFNLFCWS